MSLDIWTRIAYIVSAFFSNGISRLIQSTDDRLANAIFANHNQSARTVFHAEHWTKEKKHETFAAQNTVLLHTNISRHTRIANNRRKNTFNLFAVPRDPYPCSWNKADPYDLRQQTKNTRQTLSYSRIHSILNKMVGKAGHTLTKRQLFIFFYLIFPIKANELV